MIFVDKSRLKSGHVQILLNLKLYIRNGKQNTDSKDLQFTKPNSKQTRIFYKLQIMKEPFLKSQQQQMHEQSEFRQVKNMFERIFDPQQFSIRKGIEEIKQFGGITSVMTMLRMYHREGLSSLTNNKMRIEVFGQNTPPKGQSIIKKAATERDFTINLLLYIITLRFFIKLLFIRDGIPVESLWDQIVSFFLLFIMIFLKAMTNFDFLLIDQNEKNYYNEQWIKVKRDGQFIQTLQKCIMVGDIVRFKIDQNVRIDGIILSCDQFYVNEAQTILKRQVKQKYTILNLKQNQNNPNFDPFLLSGSKIVYGTADVLVCRIGQDCSFRLKNQKIQPFSTQVTPLIHNLKKVLKLVEKMSNMIAFLSSSYFAAYYLYDAMLHNSLSWFTFLHILKKCSSLIGFVCLLQKLRSVRSLQFYLQNFRSDKFFKIKNKCTLEKLNQVDMFIIEKEAIKIYETERGYIIPKIGFLSYLSEHYSCKIVSKDKKGKTEQEFDFLNDNQLGNKRMFFHESLNENTETRLKKLKECYFIPECPKKKLESDLIPIFQGLQYQIAYIYKIKPNQDLSIHSKKIITIGFAEQNSENANICKQESADQWVRIKNTMSAEDHIKQIMVKSTRFCQLYNIYMVQFVNNILVFLFLSWISIIRSYAIDFYWSLTIIVIARFIFFRIYRSIALERTEPEHESISHKRVIRLNAFLFLYYLYVLINLQEKINVVLFFVSNAILRTDILLIKVQRHLSVKNIVRSNLIVFGVLVGYVIVKALYSMTIHEDLRLLQYVFGLSFLLTIYGFIY